MTIPDIFKRQKWIWLVEFITIVAIKIIAQNKHLVETIYSTNFYKLFSIFLRFLFGWIPISLGDILYLSAGCWLLWKLVKNLTLIFKGRLSKQLFFQKFSRLVLLFGAIYIVFNIFWGLNYDRKTIEAQMDLPSIQYDTTNLKVIQQLLLQKVNESKQIIIDKNVAYPQNNELFLRAKSCYAQASVKYPLIEYDAASIKASFFGKMGDYLGFTGYYDPFTGEAQVNTTVPKFLRPYITLHEIGHQLGYAKEDEANFCGYLAAANSTDTLFKYSTYLDLFLYANREVFYFDSTASKAAVSQLIPEVKTDLHEWKLFNQRYTNVLEPAISWLYGKYLQVNKQPAGLHSYNQVIATLMAYYKKNGRI